MLSMNDDLWGALQRESESNLPVGVYRACYRGSTLERNSFAIYREDDHFAWHISPVNVAGSPEAIIRLMRDKRRADNAQRRKQQATSIGILAGGTMTSERVCFTHGLNEPEWIRQKTLTAFSTVQEHAFSLQDFRNARIEVYGKRMGWGTIEELLKREGLTIANSRHR